VNYGPDHIQCNYSSAYSDFNIHLNVSALLLEISRQFTARCTANLLPNTAHILQYMLCDLCSRPYTKYFQHRIFRLQYSTLGVCAAITDITSIQCALYCILGAKCRARTPDYAMSTVVPDIYKALTAPQNYALIFNSSQLPCYWRYLDYSMRVILHSWCQIKRTSSSLRYATCGPGHIHCIFSNAYLGFNIQL
jgi:hypothetical protein